jgi:ubiquinone/menaquinone biosynthesis C-methylase UbiE
MKLSKEELKTIDYYNKNAGLWSQKHGQDLEKSYFDKQMKKLFKLLPHGKILEIGSGYGKEAELLIKQYGVKNYVGIDPSSELVKLAQKRNPKAQFINISVYDIPFQKVAFDGFWTSATLIHIPKRRIQFCLEKIHAVTKKDGMGFISILEGEGDMVNSRPGRFYSLYSQKEFESILKQCGFKILENERIPTDASPWLTFIVKKSDNK